MEQETFQKTFGKFLFWVFALAAVPLPVFGTEDVTGDWEITIDFNGRQSFAALSISKKADDTLTGKWGSTELSDVRFDGQKLTFFRIIKREHKESKTNYEGTLKDGKLIGKLTGESGEFTATGVRAKPIPALIGQWNLRYKIGDREVTAKLSISQKPDGTLEGKWTSESEENVVSDVKFQDGKLTFSRKTNLPNGNESTSTFNGTVKEHKMTGTIKSERGEMAASGQIDLPCIFVGKLSVQYAGFQNRNEIVTSGLSISVRYGRASDDELKEMSLKANSNGYFHIKDVDSEAIFFPKLISHDSGWTQELRRSTGQVLQPDLQLTTSTTFGAGFSSRKPRGGIKVTSMILSLEINALGKAKWSFSNSIVDTETVVEDVLATLQKSDPWYTCLAAYLKAPSSEESPEAKYKRIQEEIKKYIVPL